MRKLRILFVAVFALIQAAFAAGSQALPEPGPEDQGLRLRLLVNREILEGEEIFNVRLDLINATRKPITLTANWPQDYNEGDFLDYLKAYVDFHTFPNINSGWPVQTGMATREKPQPKLQLAGGDFVSVEWRSKDRRLKDYQREFPSDGLYSVHATVEFETDLGRCNLRSNEQLVPVGGSHTRPKKSVARVVGADANANTVTLNLGSRDKITPGDTFGMLYGMGGPRSRMTVDRVDISTCSGKITMVGSQGVLDPEADPILPSEGIEALLIRP